MCIPSLESWLNVDLYDSSSSPLNSGNGALWISLVLADDLADEFALIQLQSTKAIFSYGTALDLWGLSDRTPHRFDITIPQGANISRLRRDNPTLRCHYVQPEIYDMGITELRPPQGALIRLYDKERCICDLIRNKDKEDIQIYTQAIKDYFNTKADRRKLLEYSKIFCVEDKVRTYMEADKKIAELYDVSEYTVKKQRHNFGINPVSSTYDRIDRDRFK